MTSKVFRDGKLQLELRGAVLTLRTGPEVRRTLERELGWGWDKAKTMPPGLAESPAAAEKTIWINHPGWEMRVIISAGDYGADGCWQHASMSLRSRVPSYGELKALHNAAFADAYAYQVFAPTSDHINDHANTLHLWGLLEMDSAGKQPMGGLPALPRFGAFGTI